jgi:AraC-like DNA-binding protein
VQLATGMDHFTPAQASRLTTVAMEVLAVRLAHEVNSSQSLPPDTRRRALLTTIHAFIQRHMGDPDLSPETIAAAHHISLRLLHKLFNEEGETVAGWIRTRRLEGTRRDLADPAQATRPVAALAAHWGFRDATSFSRTFRAAYGLPPHQYRLTSNPGYSDSGRPPPPDAPH